MKIDTNTRFTLELSIDEMVEVHSALVSEGSNLAGVLKLALGAEEQAIHGYEGKPLLRQPRPPHFAGGK